MTIRLGVLASGRGSNFRAIEDAIERGELDAVVSVLVSDRENAGALDLAKERGLRAEYIPYDREDREVFERHAADRLDAEGCDLIILAGYMRILTPYFIRRFENRILNIHPSLLPSFKGLHPQQQALDAGVKFSGATVHLVIDDLDAGPIITQAVVPVLTTDTEESLSARILEQEHRIYSDAIRLLQAERHG